MGASGSIRGSKLTATFHTCSALGRDLDALLAFLEARDKVRIVSGVVFPGGSRIAKAR